MARTTRYSQLDDYGESVDFKTEALKVAQEAAYVGGEIARLNFGKISRVSWKCDLEVQTEVDTEAEKKITNFIKKRFEEDSTFGEEFGLSKGDSSYTWVIDPLDGTNNFVLDIPQFAVCVSLKKDDDVLLTVIHHPILDITYTAVKGEGAFLNGEPIDLPRRKSLLNKSTICSILAYSVHSNPLRSSIVNRLYRGTRRLLDTWAPSLDWCLLATGKIDALVYLSDKSFHDDPGMLAGAFLFSEAGGIISDLSLSDSRAAAIALRKTSLIAASTDYMIDQVNDLINSDFLVEELA